jgi:hypothetical protein
MYRYARAGFWKTLSLQAGKVFRKRQAFEMLITSGSLASPIQLRWDGVVEGSSSSGLFDVQEAVQVLFQPPRLRGKA